MKIILLLTPIETIRELYLSGENTRILLRVALSSGRAVIGNYSVLGAICARLRTKQSSKSDCGRAGLPSTDALEIFVF